MFYGKKFHADYQKHFQAAADKGLVELVASANGNESENESEGLDELSISANENQSEN